MVTCENCGGEFSEQESCCPYCGVIYQPGAERQYWEKMGTIRDDMEALGQTPAELYKKELRQQAKKSGKWLKRTAVCLAAAAVAIGGVSAWGQARELEEEKAQILWEREQYPQLDAWYEAGDFDAILKFEEEQEGDFYIRSWEHAAFLNCYRDYQICLQDYEELRTEEADEEYRQSILADFLYFGGSVSRQEESGYDTKEWELLQQYQEHCAAMCREILRLGQEDALPYESLSKEGYVSYDACADYAEAWMKQNKGKE